MVMKHCPHCTQPLDPNVYGMELYASVELGPTKRPILQTLMKAKGEWVHMHKLQVHSTSRNAVSAACSSLNVDLVSTDYWITNRMGYGYALKRRGY